MGPLGIEVPATTAWHACWLQWGRRGVEEGNGWGRGGDAGLKVHETQACRGGGGGGGGGGEWRWKEPEDVRVRGTFKDPVQRFQLLLGEGICPKPGLSRNT
ncbi:hypothetical protein EYF80_005951 [Liparis tanakae]|uniref:Uncharacterized protein n=1 Tax=Liparis tanakae TaxID=230148 RepID=A0A4Z2J0C2_9TELE|nr:hypothetical protein EYF80_005951 [Liparis tanakae]